MQREAGYLFDECDGGGRALLVALLLGNTELSRRNIVKLISRHYKKKLRRGEKGSRGNQTLEGGVVAEEMKMGTSSQSCGGT